MLVGYKKAPAIRELSQLNQARGIVERRLVRQGGQRLVVLSKIVGSQGGKALTRLFEKAADVVHEPHRDALSFSATHEYTR